MNDLSPRALLDLLEARRYVFRDENDGSRDDILIDAVDAVSEAIWNYCEREFMQTNALARIFSVSRRGLIELAPFEIRNVTSVVLYTDRAVADQRTLTTDEFQLLPIGTSRAGTYLEIRTIAPSISELQPGFGWEATVTGDWGMLAIPDSVKLACLQWVDNIVKNPGQFASATMSGFTLVPEIDLARPAGMPPAAGHRLAYWRRGPFVR